VTDEKSPKPEEFSDTEVSLRAVTVRYGRLAAVDGLSFSLRRGECATLLGLNGAGKSTAMRR
jgi:ABC-type multidrug transport system ATPase subunit